MGKYIVIYHASAEAMASTQDMKPEEKQEGMKAWFDWAKEIGDGLVDFGTPLMGGVKLSPSGSTPSDKGVMGYSILEAENMAAAEAMLKNHPHLAWAAGCELEVHESMQVPDM
jgi:hypothetical protein